MSATLWLGLGTAASLFGCALSRTGDKKVLVPVRDNRSKGIKDLLFFAGVLSLQVLSQNVSHELSAEPAQNWGVSLL